MSAAFTPGPWGVFDDDAYAIYAHPDDVATTIADCNSGQRVVQDDDECKANARLIAAAPELYEALDGLLDAILHDVDKSKRIRAAECALAKARGDQ